MTEKINVSAEFIPLEFSHLQQSMFLLLPLYHCLIVWNLGFFTLFTVQCLAFVAFYNLFSFILRRISSVRMEFSDPLTVLDSILSSLAG